MKIVNHMLEGDECNFQESPNHSGPFGPGAPDTIVIHYTAGSSAESSVRALCDSNTKASAHLVVGRDGAVTQLVPFDTIAWHAGRSSYEGRNGFNKYAIGIEIDNAGELTKTGTGFQSWFGGICKPEDVVEAVHRNQSTIGYWHAYTEMQIARVYEICDLLITEYQINLVLGHEEIAPRRKTDPGPAFPLDKLRDRLLQRDRGLEDAEEERGETVASTGRMGLVTASKLNVRSESNRNSSIVSPPLIKGSLVNIVSEQNGWYEIDIKTRGWVKKDFVKL